MKIKTAQFVTSALTLDSCPPEKLPEFAFIGRSNVGKSSLLNMLTGQANLAKVSATPGHTRMINFFKINDAWTMVDLPGYGYAKTIKKDPQQFQKMVASYIGDRGTLRCVLVLIDSRLDPQQIDLEFVQWLIDNDIRFALVFTKSDKMKKMALQRNIEAFQNHLIGLSETLPETFVSSAETRAGKSELLAFIERKLLEPQPELPKDEDTDEEDAS
ncbi:MAG: ribosome biogenesis GTP-binding protein YihA/YsxC [Chthoniobacterales bacterium]